MAPVNVLIDAPPSGVGGGTLWYHSVILLLLRRPDCSRPNEFEQSGPPVSGVGPALEFSPPGPAVHLKTGASVSSHMIYRYSGFHVG